LDFVNFGGFRGFRFLDPPDRKGETDTSGQWGSGRVIADVVFDVTMFTRTNGHAYATVLGPSSVVWLSVTLCIVAKRCVLEQTLLLTSLREVVYEKPIGTKMNDLDHCLEVVPRSCQPSRHIRHWISRKSL